MTSELAKLHFDNQDGLSAQEDQQASLRDAIASATHPIFSVGYNAAGASFGMTSAKLLEQRLRQSSTHVLRKTDPH